MQDHPVGDQGARLGDDVRPPHPHQGGGELQPHRGHHHHQQHL